MGIKVILADTQEVYLKRLTDYIEKHFKEGYQISVCHHKEKLKEMLKLEKYDVLCFTPEMYDKDISLKKVLVPIVLEDEGVAGLEQFKYTINKYTRISKLMQYIDRAYNTAQKNKPLIYGVYGPAGGTGTSTIAISVALSYAQAGRSVCYLNLEDVNSTDLFFETRNSKELVSKENMDIASYVRRDCKSNVIYCTNVKSAMGYTNESITAFIETLLEQEVATVIVVDLGSHLSALHNEVIRQADKLFVITTQADYAVYKFEKFINEWTNLEQVAVVMNQSKISNNQLAVPVVGCVDKLYIEQAIRICEYIAQNHLIDIMGI